MFSSRPALRGSAGGSSVSGFLSRAVPLSSCDRTSAIRTFVVLVGLVILVANLTMLMQLSTESGPPDHRPNGGPIDGHSEATHAPSRPLTGPSLIQSKQGITRTELVKRAIEKSTPTEETDAPTTTTSTTPVVTPAALVAAATLAAAAAAAAESDASSSARTSIWSKAASSDCERQFGNGFTDSWSYCSAAASTPNTARLDCRRNTLTGSTACEAINLRVDMSKIHVARGGEPIESVRGRQEGEEFAKYDQGAFTIPCTANGAAVSKERTPHHLGDMLSRLNYIPAAVAPEEALGSECVWIEEPTLFVTRYEYANLYHSMGDFYNAYQTQWMYGVKKAHVVFFDGHSAGALDEMWPKLFSEHVTYLHGLSAKYAPDLGSQKTFCFRRALFVSPAYKCALGVDMMMRGSSGSCGPNPPLEDFSKAVLGAYDLEHQDPWALFPEGQTTSRDVFGKPLLPRGLDLAQTPLVTVIFRKDYLAHPRLQSLAASRKVLNEAEIGEALALISDREKVHAIGVDMAKLNIAQQLQLVRLSTVLIGIHGAGLSHALFLEPSASLLEIVPPEYGGRVHFKYFAQWAARTYRTIPATADRGGGHMVPKSDFENSVTGILIEHRAGTKRVRPTDGWAVHRDITQKPPRPSKAKRVLSSPSPSASKRPAGPYTPGMIDDRLPRDWTTPSFNATFADQGRDLGLSGNQEHRLCVLVPFRDSKSLTSQGSNRTGNLLEMIPWMIKHLEGGGMRLVRDFEIIVIEQTEGVVFNKGALFNVGYIHAKKAGCDYMVLHDVDQLPLSPGNTYSYPPEGPVHLCSASSQYGYQLAYGTMVGGALLLTMQHFESVNGYSNFYFGWGQEDDDFFYRLAGKFGDVKRLSAQDGRYRALEHPRVRDLDVTPVFSKGTQHLTETRRNQFDIQTDGISNLKYSLEAVERWTKWPRGVRKFVADLQLKDMPRDLNGKTS